MNLSGLLEPGLCQLQIYGMPEALAQIYIFFVPWIYLMIFAAVEYFPISRSLFALDDGQELFAEITIWAPCLALG